MYDTKTIIHTIIFITCISFYFLSHDTSIPVYMEEVSAEEIKTTSGSMASGILSQVQVGGKEDGTKAKSGYKMDGRLSEKVACDAECKIETLKDIGIRPEIAESLVMNCKALTDDPVNCIRIGAFIVGNESTGGTRCKKKNIYNCFGMSVNEDYKSYNDGVIHWIGKYNKFWFRQSTPDHFYSNSPDWIPRTKYCMSEKQPNGTMLSYCPNGYKNAWIIYNKLKEW